MSETISVVKVASISEIKSPYANDETITHYYNPYAESKEEFARAYRSTQDKLREFEQMTDGKFTRSVRGRVTNLKAFDAWLLWKTSTRGLAKKPKFDFKES